MLDCQSLMEKFSPFRGDIACLEIESLRKTKRPKRFSDEADAEEAAAAANEETTSLPSNAVIGFPQLPEEPNHDSDHLCKIRVRLPDGRKIQRNFLKSESVQLLWSFCYSQIDHHHQSSMVRKPFKLFQASPGNNKTLHYGSNTTFEQSGLANSLVSVTWA